MNIKMTIKRTMMTMKMMMTTMMMMMDIDGADNNKEVMMMIIMLTMTFMITIDRFKLCWGRMLGSCKRR